MGFLEGSGHVFIGTTEADQGHLYHFSRALHRLFAVYREGSNVGVCKQSTDSGQTWTTVERWENCHHITVRGQYVGLNIGGERIQVYDLDEGWPIFSKPYVVNTPVIPIPECAGLLAGVGTGSTAHVYRFMKVPSGTLGSQLPGPLHAVWGTEAPYSAGGGWRVNLVWHYTDPFFPLINRPVYATASGVNFSISYARAANNSPVGIRGYPEQTQWEGFVSGADTLRGVSAARNYQPNQSTVQGVWQSGTPSPPYYFMDVRNPDVRFPVHSVSSGHLWDDVSQKRACRGIVNGYDTVGMVEPGGVFSYSWVQPGTEAAPQFPRKKALGVFDPDVAVGRIWMPYENGLFGVGIYATSNSRTGLWWIWDMHPMEQETRAILSDSGEYQKVRPVAKSTKGTRRETHWW